MLNPIATNSSDAIVEPFWASDQGPDGSRKNLFADWTLKFHPAAVVKNLLPNYWVIQGVPAGARALTLTRRGGWAVEGYDTIEVFGQLSSNASVTIRAVVDSAKAVDLVGGECGNDTFEVFSGRISGKVLRRPELIFIQTAPGELDVFLNWIGLCDRKRRTALKKQRSVKYSPDWPGLLVRPEASACLKLGLCFSAKDLGRFRRRIGSGPLKKEFEALRQTAEKMLTIPPEAFIGEYAPNFDKRFCHPDDAKMPWLGVGVMDTLAFVGLVDECPEMSRLAVRMALSVAHCQSWTHSLMGNFPGSVAHPRCFLESFFLRSIPLVMDWAGDHLSLFGHELLRDAMILKGLARVESDFMRWEYIRHMNQGPMFSVGRILAYLALLPTYPRYQARLDEAERDLHEMLSNYIQPDGGTLEGMGYWHIIGDILPVLEMLARAKKMSLSDYAGERILRTGEFALGMLSTRGDGCEFLPINAAGQNHTRPTAYVAGCFAQLLPHTAWPKIYHRVRSTEIGTANLAHWVRMVNGSGEKSAGKKTVVIPSRSRLLAFPQTGQVDWVRQHSEFGTVHFHFCSGPSKGGHSHQDKGSLILEVGEDALLVDRGTVGYDRSEHKGMARAEQHNLLCPVAEGGIYFQQKPAETRGGRLIEAGDSHQVLTISSDQAGAWEAGLFKKNIRRIRSLGEQAFLIEDEVAFHAPHAFSLLFNSQFPIEWETSQGGLLIRGSRVSLRILPVGWQPLANEVGEFGIDCSGEPAHRAALAYGPTNRTVLRTLLHIAPPEWSPSGRLAPELKTVGMSSTARDFTDLWEKISVRDKK